MRIWTFVYLIATQQIHSKNVCRHAPWNSSHSSNVTKRKKTEVTQIYFIENQISNFFNIGSMDHYDAINIVWITSIHNFMNESGICVQKHVRKLYSLLKSKQNKTWLFTHHIYNETNVKSNRSINSKFRTQNYLWLGKRGRRYSGKT